MLLLAVNLYVNKDFYTKALCRMMRETQDEH